MNGTHTKPAFCSQICLDAPPSVQRAEQSGGNHQRHDELRHRYAQIAQTCVQPHRRAFFGLRKEKADVGHARREISAAQTAQQRQQQHGAVGGVGILDGHAQADGGQQQAGGGKRRPTPAAEHGHHKRIERAESRPRQRGYGGQPEKLVGRVVETDARQVDDRHAPHLPNGKRQHQRGNRNPQIAPRRFSAAVLPKFRVLRLPVLNQSRHLPPLFFKICWSVVFQTASRNRKAV